MTKFLQLAFQGLTLGAVYGLIALGFVIVFKGSRVFNFAHGDFVMSAAYVVIALSPLLPYGLAVAAAMLAMVAVALLVERLMLRPLIGSSMFTLVLVTLGLSTMVRAVAAMIWGTEEKGSADPIGDGVTVAGGVTFSHTGLATLAVSALLLAGLWLFYQRTGYGLALRATAAHQEAALAQGIDARTMFALSWAIAGVLAVAAGIFLGAFPRQVSPAMGVVALSALPAIIIGGFESLVGAVTGGVIVGMIQVLGAGYLTGFGGGKLHEVLPYLAMLAVLVIRPHGLFGRPEIERV